MSNGLSSSLPALTVLVVLALVQDGCAKHSDFVDMRQELRAMARSQEEAQKRERDTQRRLQALEVTKESSPDRQRLDELSGRLKSLEARISRFEDIQQSQSPSSLRPDSLPGEPSRQSKPAKLPPPPEPAPLIPGVPGITPTSAFNLAYNDYLNGRYDLAVTGFQRFLKDFPSTSLAPSAHYWLGESYYNLKDYVRAMQAFDRVVKEYPGHEKVPSALFKLGLSAAETGDIPRAREYLKQVIEKFSTSDEAKLAKNKLAEIR
ncbi:MAG TPA: tol-pal system protein YbgF [Nitrospiraceae bacterium]|nr:tol-pal system protein YbgF [Nitrospiraceae bacterium]